MSPPASYVPELSVEVEPCATLVLAIEATPAAPGSGEDPAPAEGTGRLAVSLVQMVPGEDGTQVEQPVTTIESVVLRHPDRVPRTIPVAIATSGAGVGTGVVDAIAAGTYTLELLPIIFFGTGQSAVPEAEKPKIAAMAEIVNGLGERGVFTLRVCGHTDIQGSKRDNQALSQSRATSVADLLRSLLQDQVRDRVEILREGMGAPAGKQAIDPADRRVELVLQRARAS